MSRHLNIVCLDVPWPPDYGGAIDMMNRIRMMKQKDVAIHLHYFSYNERGTPNELNQFCESIHVYERKTGYKGLSPRLPYIISSRINEELIDNLKKNDYPVLLEGIHCTGILPHLEMSKRKIVVRMHNEESLYYKEMARSEKNIFKKIYFSNESRLLKKYNFHLPQDCVYASVSKEDIRILKEKYHLPNVIYVPTFPSWQTVNSNEGLGDFCLYHGNLSVPENEKVACWLLRKVFSRVRMPLVIAGKKPSRRLIKEAHLCQHTCLVADPSESELNDLVRKAHIHVLPSFNKCITGIRLKLLHALFEGRHCIVNDSMVAGTGLEDACHIGNRANAISSIIAQLHHKPFEEEEILLRKRLMENTFNNSDNTELISQYLW